MKTIIEFKDGRKKTFEDVVPIFSVGDGYFFLSDRNSEVVSEDFQDDAVKSVVVELD
jgi:hypothetical protein